jgi:hypothetical protein
MSTELLCYYFAVLHNSVCHLKFNNTTKEHIVKMETLYWSTIYQIPTSFLLKRVIKITKPTAIEKRKLHEI